MQMPYTGNGPPFSNPLDTSTLGDFELGLFVGAHEAAHQNGIDSTKEGEANWYGEKAVENCRKDGNGNKCK